MNNNGALLFVSHVSESTPDIWYVFAELDNTVKIEGTSNPWVAGRSGYSLTCVVTADIAPEITWRDGNSNQITNTNSSGDVFVSRPVVSGRTTRLTLNFNSLRTSHGASYSCLSVITVPSSIQVALRDVIVKSEFMVHDNLHNVMLHVIHSSTSHGKGGASTR
jgi:hypothetical protein